MSIFARADDAVAEWLVGDQTGSAVLKGFFTANFESFPSLKRFTSISSANGSWAGVHRHQLPAGSCES